MQLTFNMEDLDSINTHCATYKGKPIGTINFASKHYAWYLSIYFEKGEQLAKLINHLLKLNEDFMERELRLICEATKDDAEHRK